MNNNIGYKIRKLREKKDWSQKELGDYLEVSQMLHKQIRKRYR